MDSSDSSATEASLSRNQTGAKDEDAAIRSSLHFSIGRMCLAEEQEAGGARMSSKAIAALTELTYQYATTSLANDLVSFSQHANRRTVTVDDVKLMARKEPNGVLAELNKFCSKNDLGTSAAGGRKNGSSKTGGGAGRQAKQLKGTKPKSGGSKSKQASRIMQRINAPSSSSDESGSADSDDDDHTPTERGNSRVRSIIEKLSNLRTPTRESDPTTKSDRQKVATAADNKTTDDMVIDLVDD